ncbi:phage baseplate protein [Paraburkholderia bannensis]|uniref:phage baseplate protein n=1 Tax=Paraburkholderia bannensis TaxID=765414 RepID=UPI0012EB12BE|nr:hypothetical protein [Paraburkholderia bannensis]
MPIISVPLYPDVPFADGVPSVLRAPGTVTISTDPALILADAIGILQNVLTPVWGVFDDTGLPVAIADTTLMLEYMADSRVANYPQEQGAFGSYNKVQVPYRGTVSLVCGRTVADREAFLAAIDAAKQSTDLYTIATPDATYADANIVAYDYRRTTKNGAALLIVNLHIEEIRQTGTAAFANTQNPASADPVNQGQVQTQTPTAAQSALFGPVSVASGVGGVV